MHCSGEISFQSERLPSVRILREDEVWLVWLRVEVSRRGDCSCGAVGFW